ncbi:MAG: methyltransferase [Pseudomonadota bacterium]
MDIETWTPKQLMATSNSYWEACALHAGVQLDLFTVIGADALSAKEIADRLGADLRGTTMLLNALVAMGLLGREQDRYANTTAGQSFLNKESPQYIGYLIRHHHNLMRAWEQLSESVRKGEPFLKDAISGDEGLEPFLMGMFNSAMGIAPQLALQIDLSGRRALLDLGGGPGTYAIHFCLENPSLRATVYDLPGTEPFAKKTIERFGMSDRIDFMPGDYLKKDLKGQYDVVWLSHILHAAGPAECRMILEKTVSVLEPGGMVLVHDFILDDSFDGPLFPALFSLNMLVNTKQGQAYSQGQIEEMLLSAGFKDIRRLPFQGPSESGIIIGIR